MLGFRDPFEDYFAGSLMRNLDDDLALLWTDFGTLTPDAHMPTVASSSPVGAVTAGTAEKKEEMMKPNGDYSKKEKTPEEQQQTVVQTGGSSWLQDYMRAPHVDIVQREKEFVINVDLPGVRKEDMKVNITEGTLLTDCFAFHCLQKKKKKST